jgi:hypothetical protein
MHARQSGYLTVTSTVFVAMLPPKIRKKTSTQAAGHNRHAAQDTRKVTAAGHTWRSPSPVVTLGDTCTSSFSMDKSLHGQ